MNYELAKQLEEAGFPQEGFGMRWTGSVWTTKDIDSLYKPTLSELIEETLKKCQFLTLQNENAHDWMAWPDLDESKGLKCYGQTPEEAMARLWLILNKKKKSLGLWKGKEMNEMTKEEVIEALECLNGLYISLLENKT